MEEAIHSIISQFAYRQGMSYVANQHTISEGCVQLHEGLENWKPGNWGLQARQVWQSLQSCDGTHSQIGSQLSSVVLVSHVEPWIVSEQGELPPFCEIK